jgi:hypothetical protein
MVETLRGDVVDGLGAGQNTAGNDDHQPTITTQLLLDIQSHPTAPDEGTCGVVGVLL